MKRGRVMFLASLITITACARMPLQPAAPQQSVDYDLLIKGGHVIDGRKRISAVRAVAMKAGRVAAVAANIPAARALKSGDASGLYGTPGLIDIHVHMYPGEKKNDYAGGDWCVYPDG